ncbi:MAG TPA: pitrilysin family protein [Thermoanaerobaculia bacterium]|nr:pitrilysin family protein [Thermoanaerobaculia bacterium]
MKITRFVLSRFALSITALALLTGAASAQEAKPKQTPPPPKPAKEIRFPAFEEKTLANGLRLVVIEQHETPSLSAQLLFPGGKVHAPAGKAGLADATAALVREGTTARSAQQIAQTIDSVGGVLTTGASLESGFAGVRVTSDQLDLALDLLSDVILRPSFPAEELERWRNQTLSGLQIQQTDPEYIADAAFVQAVYGGHPYGQPATGTPESVQGLTRDDLAAFHRRQYVPNESILAIVGDVKAADAFAKAERFFGAWKRGEESRIPAVKPAQAQRRIVIIDKPDAVQTQIRVGQIAIGYRDPDHFAAQVYDSVVGSSSNSRLYEEVRRKRGLSYGAFTDLRLPSEPGWFLANTFTKTESTAEALGLVLEVLEGMGKTPVPAEELETRKTYLTGAFPLEIETPDGIAGKVLEAMKFGYGREYLESYRDKLGAVTAEQVKSFAGRRLQPDRMLVVLVGNAKAFAADVEKRFGKAETIPIGEVDLLQPGLRKSPHPPAPSPASPSPSPGEGETE